VSINENDLTQLEVSEDVVFFDPRIPTLQKQLNLHVEIPLPRIYNFNSRNLKKLYPDFNSSLIYPWVAASHRARIPVYINFEGLLDEENQQILFNIIESKPDMYTINSLIADQITGDIIGLVPSSMTRDEFYQLYDLNMDNLTNPNSIEVRSTNSSDTDSSSYIDISEPMIDEVSRAYSMPFEIIQETPPHIEEAMQTPLEIGAASTAFDYESKLVSGFTPLTYAEEIYDRTFALHKVLDIKAGELMQVFKRAESITSYHARKDVEQVGQRFLDGDLTAIPDFEPFFNNLSIPLDLFHANAYVRYKFKSNSRVVMLALQSKAPKLQYYLKALEEIKFIIGGSGALVDSVYDYEDFIVKDCGPKGSFKKEISLWLNRPHRTICPIDYVSENGRFIIMPKCERVLLIDPILKMHKINSLRGFINLSNKAQIWKVKNASNWGKLDGEYVIINYASNKF
jgi:hypothetical protein